MRVYELAKKHKLSSEELMRVLASLGLPVKNHMSTASDEMMQALNARLRPQAQAKAEAAEPVKKREPGKLQSHLQDRLALVKARMQKREEMTRQKAELLKNVVSAPERRTEPGRVEAPRREEPPPVAGEQAPPAAVAAAPPSPAEPAPPAAPETIRATIREGELFRPKLVSAAPERTAERKPPAAAKPSGQTYITPGRRRKKRKKKEHEAVVDRKAVEATLKRTMASLDGSTARKKRRSKDHDGGEGVAEPSRVVLVSEFMTVAELANHLERRPSEVVAKLMELGQMATINQRLDFDTIEMVALEFDYGVERAEDKALDVMEEEDLDETLKPRPPVVTVMGHVDHGKTSLLDYIRHANVIAGEAGGITQHIGAYNVLTTGGAQITFLDTPGHEAFSAMRARGAQVTDCVILVVSATEGVMPQTVEAIDHAKAAGVPIMVAVNKIDLPEANPERVRQMLTEYGLVPEAWGGNTIFADISAKTGQGVDKLEELIVLQTELLELKANPDRLATGRVLEAQLDKGKGPVVNALIQRGTLRVGDPVVAGPFEGRVRAMLDERENRLIECTPGSAVQILGLSGVPQAGDLLVAYASDDEAHRVAQSRAAIKREQDIRHKAGASVGDWARRIAEGEIKELKIIIKGDVGGSVEALSDTLERIEHPEVKVRVIHRGVGMVTESDVLLATASDALVLAFHVIPDSKARETAAREQVTIREYKVIYEAEEDIKKLLEGMLGMDVREEVRGRIEVRQLFKVPKVGMIAGCYVLDGQVRRGARVRVIRDGVIIHEDTIETLRRFKDDVREVASGFECGIRLGNFQDVKVGDRLELLVEVQTARTLV
jgi:translation initiation factor IF-2